LVILRLVHFLHRDESPRGCIGSFQRPEDTHSCGETSSPQVVIDVVIY